jgi:histidinol dehydrogenase
MLSSSFKENSAVLIADSLEQCIAFSNKFAFELHVLYR